MAKKVLFNHKMCYNSSIQLLLSENGVYVVDNMQIDQNQAVEVSYVLDNLSIEGTNAKEFFYNPTEEIANVSYEVVRDAVQKVLLEREQYWKEQHDQIQAQYELERAEREKAQASEATAAERNVKLLAELNEAQLMLSDAESKRDAAVAQAEEKDETIERLNKEIAELNKQLSVNTVAAPKAVDAGDSYARWKAQKQREEEAKPAIYDVQLGDNRGSFYVAKLAATDEEIKIPYLEKGKYREVSAEEAPQFRVSQEPERDNEDMAQPESVEETSDLTPPTWQFPNEEESSGETAGHELAQGQLAGSVDTETAGEVTRAEFEELKRRVAALEAPTEEVA